MNYTRYIATSSNSNITATVVVKAPSSKAHTYNTVREENIAV